MTTPLLCWGFTHNATILACCYGVLVHFVGGVWQQHSALMKDNGFTLSYTKVNRPCEEF